MIKMSLTANIQAAQKTLESKARQVRFATAVAITRTAQDVQRAVPAALDKALDRPTEFTKRGTYVRPARRDQLVAEVGFRPIQAKYMAFQVKGGTYQNTSGGIRLPGNIQLNAFGNIPRGTIKKLKDAAQSGKLSAAIAKRINAQGNRRKGAAPLQLFYGQPTGKGWQNAPIGIWRRIPGSAGGKGKLVPVVVFEKSPARYQKRFDFVALGQATVKSRFAGHFQAEYQKAIATAR